jgi:chemotaxis protein MotA
MRTSKAKRLDYATFAGLAVAAAGIVGGLLLEKGRIYDLTQSTAALIVFGGTIGALLISTPSANLLRAIKRCRLVLFRSTDDLQETLERILSFSNIARRTGISSLETHTDKLEDKFFRKGMLLAVDGADTKEIRHILELEMRIEEDRAEADAGVFETAAGYAPTIGIIGAVLGLIQVMKRLDNINDVGKGIAVAFVATVYGVGFANLVLLPVAAKIRQRACQESDRRELALEGILAIAAGLNPYLIRSRLESYLEDRRSLPATPKPTPVVRGNAVRSGS